MMNLRVPLFALMLLAGLALAEAPSAARAQIAMPPGPPDWLDYGWAQHPLWDDGLAEVSTYDTTTTLSRKPRRHQTTVIVTKEEFTRRLHVRADAPARESNLLPVLKMNVLAGPIPTENYPYTFTASVFLDRANPARCVRATAVTTEWNGITMKDYRNFGPRPILRTHSYWDGEGDRDFTVDPEAVPLEALPLLLRAAKFDEVPEFRMWALPSFMTNRVLGADATSLVVRALADETIETPVGHFPCRTVEVRNVRNEALLMTLWIEKNFPNRMVRKTTTTGREFRLVESRRWNFQDR